MYIDLKWKDIAVGVCIVALAVASYVNFSRTSAVNQSLVSLVIHLGRTGVIEVQGVEKAPAKPVKPAEEGEKDASD